MGIPVNRQPQTVNGYRDRWILLPTLLSWNDSGISWENFQMALSPVQCIGMTISGASFFISARFKPSIFRLWGRCDVGISRVEYDGVCVTMNMDLHKKRETMFGKERAFGNHPVFGKGRANDGFTSRKKHI